MSSLPEGIDQRFLEFIGVTEAKERAIHSYYLQFFQPGQQVLDLGCGAGYFVKMLREQGIEASGIDLDPAAIKKAREQNLPVEQAEALDYLRKLPAASLDAVFSAHLVEHLEVEAVYNLIKEAQRALKPDGFLLVTTPNVRALVSHLEMFWLHFDHKRFYHPRLLEFFMKDCRFDRIIFGENGQEQHYIQPASNGNISATRGDFNWQAVIPRPRSLILRPWWRFKLWLVELIVLPYVATLIPPDCIGRSFEVYVIGYKSEQ
jgi:SAM-dependent methyltransferase